MCWRRMTERTGGRKRVSPGSSAQPTYEEAHHSYSHFLMAAGRHDDYFGSKRLLELDPFVAHERAQWLAFCAQPA